MNISTTLRTSMAVLTIGVLSGCGGSSSNPPPTTPTPPPTGGISRNGIAIGPISTFGSVVVNGVRYETDSATSFIINDDTAGTQADLRVGDTVIITATLDEDSGVATATQIIYEDAVTGPVEAIDAMANLLTVLGQTVRVTADTSFDDDFAIPSIEGIALGQIVEVSGTVDSNQNIIATRIEPEDPGTGFEVQGVVESLDNAAQTFSLGNLVVDFSAAMLMDFPVGSINNGDLVEAKGASLGANGELLADEVEFEDSLPDLDEDDFAEIEGFVTRFASATDFDVAGVPVTTNTQTSFEGGVAADIALNTKLEVEGDFNANGILVASEIEFRTARAIRVSALVDAVDATANSIVVLNIPVNTDELTRFEDKTDAALNPLTIAQISVGDFVEVRGSESPAGSGQLAAAILERDDVDDTELQGFPSAITEPSFEILGVTVETNGATEFRDQDDQPISAPEFFAQLTTNQLVKASGTEISSATLLAEEVELEDED